MARVGTVRRVPGDATGSLVDEVGRQVRAASAELPVPELRAARLRLGQAGLRLGQVLDATSTARAVPTLRAAGEHLDLATGALLRAQDALAEYLQMIGLPPGDRTGPPAAPTPTARADRLRNPPRADRGHRDDGRREHPERARGQRGQGPPRNDRSPGRDRTHNERTLPPEVNHPRNERSRTARGPEHPRNDRGRPVNGAVGDADEDGDVPMGAG